MDVDILRRFAMELLRRQPAAYADIVNGELVHGDGFQSDPEPGNNSPEWCSCQHCVIMPTQEENKCCTQVRRPLYIQNKLIQTVSTGWQCFRAVHEIQRGCIGSE